MIQDLGTLGGPGSEAYDINDAGQVVGQADDPDGHPAPFLWEAGTMSPLPTGFWPNAAAEISSSGEVVGCDSSSRCAPTGPPQAIRWIDGVPTELLIPCRFGTGSCAVAINDVGEVAGFRGGEPFRWHDGVTTFLPAPLNPEINAMNNSGAIVGYSQGPERAVLWSGTSFSFLEGLPGSDSERAYDVNDAGQVVGFSSIEIPVDPTFTRYETHAVRWEGGTVTDLGLGIAQAINQAGVVAGAGADDPDGRRPAVIWEGTEETPVSSALSLCDGWTELTIHAINESGHMVGVGRRDGENRAVRIVPETTSFDCSAVQSLKLSCHGSRIVATLRTSVPLTRIDATLDCTMTQSATTSRGGRATYKWTGAAPGAHMAYLYDCPAVTATVECR